MGEVFGCMSSRFDASVECSGVTDLSLSIGFRCLRWVGLRLASFCLVMSVIL